MNLGAGIMGLAIGAGSGAIAGLASFGLYGYLKEEKGMGTWGAGAATGALSGIMGGLALMALAVAMPDQIQQMQGLTVQELNGVTVKQLPRAMGMVTAQRLSGISAEVL